MYYRCEKCNFVSMDFALANPDKPCPNCGKNAVDIGRRMFPRIQVQLYRKMVQKYFIAEKSYSKDILQNASEILKKPIKYAKDLFDGWIEENEDNLEKAIRNAQEKIQLDNKDDVFKLIELSIKYETPDEMKTCVILIDSLIESLLFEFIDEILYFNKTSKKIHNSIIGQIKTRYQLISFVESILKCKINQVIPKLELGDGFWVNVKRIRLKRNKFIHGNPYAINRGDYSIALDLTKKAYGIFAGLNNKYLVRA